MASILHRLLFAVLTYVFNCSCKLLSLVNSVKCIITTGIFAHKYSDDYVLQKIGKELELRHKLPKHVVCLYTETENIDLNNISETVRWISEIGVRYISLYDHDGSLVRHKELLRKLLTKKTSDCISKDSFQLEKFVFEENHNNMKGWCEDETVRVMLLSHLDGQRHFAEMVKNLVNLENVMQEAVENEVRKHFLPEPELLLQFGCPSSNILLGYPSWDLRLTEMLRLPNRKITTDHIASCFQRYGRCEQRFGK